MNANLMHALAAQRTSQSLPMPVESPVVRSTRLATEQATIWNRPFSWI